MFAGSQGGARVDREDREVNSRRLQFFLFALVIACCLFLGADLDVLLSSPGPTEYRLVGWSAAVLSGLCAAGCTVAGVKQEYAREQ